MTSSKQTQICPNSRVKNEFKSKTWKIFEGNYKTFCIFKRLEWPPTCIGWQDRLIFWIALCLQLLAKAHHSFEKQEVDSLSILCFMQTSWKTFVLYCFQQKYPQGSVCAIQQLHKTNSQKHYSAITCPLNKLANHILRVGLCSFTSNVSQNEAEA